jgi:ribosome-associated toxin RatA of RatAB toxin-antitoxin module
MSEAQEQVFTTDVSASVPHCFATITDFEAYPSWFAAVEQTEVIARHRGGLAKRVVFHVDMVVKTVRYVLEYEYEKPKRLWWKAVAGDVQRIEGSYCFEPLGPARTRATCRQTVAFGFWIPGPIRGAVERQALKQSVLEFKAAAERAGKAGRTRRRRSEAAP